MTQRDWTPTDAADAADADRDRQWWKRPDPFDPRNAPDEPEPSPSAARPALRSAGGGER